MINCCRRSNLRRFITYRDENGWLDARDNVHAIIAGDDSAVVNGAGAMGARSFLVVKVRWTCLLSTMPSERIND